MVMMLIGGLGLRDSHTLACTLTVCFYLRYKSELESAGFKVREATDVTADWRKYTADRVAKFTSDRERLEPILGRAVHHHHHHHH